MNNKNLITGWGAMLVLTLGLTPVAANESVVCDTTGEAPGQCSGEFDGSLYVVVKDNGVLWEEADEAAGSMVRNGVKGHLVTITSYEEDKFVDDLRRHARSQGVLHRFEVWAGGFQDPATETHPEAGWTWVNDEGPFVYTNWLPDEPNDNTGGGSEQHLGIGLRNEFGWNDEGALGNIGGYIVEFDNTSKAQNCLETTDGVGNDGGCNPSGVQIVELPQELKDRLVGKTITQFLVPRRPEVETEVCDQSEFVGPDLRVNELTGAVEQIRPLDLNEVFDLSVAFPDLDESDLNGKYLLRADTVGSPCLALVFGEANFAFADFASLFFDDGPVAAITQDAKDVPGMNPGTQILDEVGPFDPAGQPDLQFVPQAAYLTNDPLLLPEGAMSPFTSDAFNPSRKKTFQFSLYGLNTREVCLFIDPALSPDDSDGGAAYYQAVYECKVDLAEEYFESLKQILFEAKPNLNGPFGQLVSKLSKVRGPLNTQRWPQAIAKLEDLREAVIFADWTIDPRNDPGHLIMRIDNLLWRFDQLDQAEQELAGSSAAGRGRGRGR